MKRDYRDFLEDILDAIEKVEEFVDHLDYNTFITDNKTLYAVRTALQVMGEAANNIPKELRDEFDEISWRKIIGFRHHLVHNYFGLKVKIIWSIIKDELPVLKPQIKKCYINTNQPNGIRKTINV